MTAKGQQPDWSRVAAGFDLWLPQLAPVGARLLDALGARPGERVLDVACGTGVLAREAAGRVGAAGRVTGLDVNEGMLAVARARAPGVDWRRGPAEAIDEPDGSFDAVVSQFGLMFFEDRVAALREMRRVLRPGGRLVVAVWAGIDDVPGYAAMTALLDRLFGARIADELRAPFCLGDTGALRALFAAAGMADGEIRTLPGSARFPSVEDWVRTDVKGWTLAELIDDDQYATLQREAPAALRHFVQPDGTVAFANPAHVAMAAKN